MKKIVLIGFAACYKTTVGKLLSTMLDCAFVDTDEQLEKTCGMSVQQIFDTHGEPFFRDKESQLLSTLTKDNTVVACGGGAVLSQAFDKFAQDSLVIELTASAKTVHARLGGGRPLFDGLTVNELNDYMRKRAPLYAKYSQATLPTDGRTSRQVAEEICNWIQSNNK